MEAASGRSTHPPANSCRMAEQLQAQFQASLARFYIPGRSTERGRPALISRVERREREGRQAIGDLRVLARQPRILLDGRSHDTRSAAYLGPLPARADLDVPQRPGCLWESSARPSLDVTRRRRRHRIVIVHPGIVTTRLTRWWLHCVSISNHQRCRPPGSQRLWPRTLRGLVLTPPCPVLRSQPVQAPTLTCPFSVTQHERWITGGAVSFGKGRAGLSPSGAPSHQPRG